MNGVLLTAGVVAILAAVVGGGLSAFDLTVPVIESRAKQAALFGVGVLFIGTAWLLRDKGDGAETAYRNTVSASCERITAATGGDLAIEVYTARPNEFNKEPLVRDLRRRHTSATAELGVLWAKAAPESLRDERAAAESAAKAWLDRFGRRIDDLAAMPGDVIAQAEVDRLSTAEDTQTRVKVNDAMSDLAGKNCAIAGA